jgi:CubicO group peptidase (beta-lactamase class C family)
MGCSSTVVPDDAPLHLTTRAPSARTALGTAAADDLRQALVEFQYQRIRPEGGRGFRLVEDSEFFTLDWESPRVVEAVMGAFPLKTRWFDAHGVEVKRVGAPGRYAAVVEGTLPGGMLVRRARTFYARPRDWRPEFQPPPGVSIAYLPGSPIHPAVWAEQSPWFAARVGEEFVRGLLMEEEGAILTAGLAEMRPLGRKPRFTEQPDVLHDEHQLAIKRQLMGLPAAQPLAAPLRLATLAPVLRPGSPAEAGFSRDVTARLSELCRSWYARSGEPFVTLVARNGVIVYHEAMGEMLSSPVNVRTQFRVASLTKLLCGQMFARFIDQGLIALDDPVGHFFPEFPARGDAAVTLRHCFTHTTGLEGHGIWGGMRNPYLENVIANGLDYLEPGLVHRYNGMGYNLAAKVMEAVSGKSFVRLFHEDLFRPLGMEETPFFDLGFSAELSAADLAKIGQLMANRGAYGEYQFYSPATFEKILPRPLTDYFPALAHHEEWRDMEWGAGLVWMRQPAPAGGWVLGPNVLGHGSASGCILRVDLDSGIVIAQVRMTAGGHYDEYVERLLTTVATCRVGPTTPDASGRNEAQATAE